uniref:phosphoethanolamine N-methyltransferase n=1 Tax=Acrobeloides nanus TaxID=290746 RepID=A0A914CB09_9BILA
MSSRVTKAFNNVRLKTIKANIRESLRLQFQNPQFSFTTSIATRIWSRGSKPVLKAVIDQLDIKPDYNILEIGYGRGDGLALACAKLRNGTGQLFGIEKSEYMERLASRRFVVEIMAENKMFLNRAKYLAYLPYPSNYFDSIFHVDVFYFWEDRTMFDSCSEFLRVLKPGGQIVCGMELNRLKKLEKWGILNSKQNDPMKYTIWLEPTGFTDVKISYHTVEKHEVQLISAKKPETLIDEDPEVVMKRLEEEIKQYMFFQSLADSMPMSKDMRQKFSDSVIDGHVKEATKKFTREKELLNKRQAD